MSISLVFKGKKMTGFPVTKKSSGSPKAFLMM
jgi:hypothetical protein